MVFRNKAVTSLSSVIFLLIENRCPSELLSCDIVLKMYQSILNFKCCLISLGCTWVDLQNIFINIYLYRTLFLGILQATQSKLFPPTKKIVFNYRNMEKLIHCSMKNYGKHRCNVDLN